MIRFIQLTDGTVIFGEGSEMHSNILQRSLEKIFEGDEACCGGGFADVEKKKMWGKSVDLGKFDADLARKTFPDWQVLDD